VRISVVRGAQVAETVAAFAAAQPGALVAVARSAPVGIARLRRGSVGADVVRRASGPVLLLSTHAPATASLGDVPSELGHRVVDDGVVDGAAVRGAVAHGEAVA
jgi:hypothetical protein